MAATIKEVAEKAGVSRGTVDRALHDRAGVNPEVALKVRKAAKELGYVPNPTARSLASRRYIKKIDVILCSLGNPFFIEVKSGIESALQELSSIGVTGSIIEIKGFDEKKELCALDQAAEEHVDGIVITPVNSRAISEKLEKLKEQGIEIVTINSDIHKPEKLAYVGCDYVASGDVGGKLIGIMSNGLTEHIAVIIGSMKVKAQAERLFGIKQVLKKHYPNDVIDSVIENEDDDQICFDRLDSLLAANHDISVICFAAAGVAGGLKAIEKYEKKRKLKVITYDLTDIVKKNLQNERIVASVCQEPYRQGYEGMMVLGKYLCQGVAPENPVINTRVYIVTKYNI